MPGLSGPQPCPRNLDHQPDVLTALVGQPVTVILQGDRPGEGEFQATLDYVKRTWVGVSWIYRGRLHREHIPVETIRKIKVVERLPRRRRPSPS